MTYQLTVVYGTPRRPRPRSTPTTSRRTHRWPAGSPGSSPTPRTAPTRVPTAPPRSTTSVAILTFADRPPSARRWASEEGKAAVADVPTFAPVAPPC